MSKCYCETVYDGYCGYCFDEVERERDKAQECLREIISQLTLIDSRPSGETWQLSICDGDEVKRWRKAAKMKEKQ